MDNKKDNIINISEKIIKDKFPGIDVVLSKEELNELKELMMINEKDSEEEFKEQFEILEKLRNQKKFSDIEVKILISQALHAGYCLGHGIAYAYLIRYLWGDGEFCENNIQFLEKIDKIYGEGLKG